MLTSPLPEAVREPEEVLLVDCIQYRCKGLLHNLVFQRCNPQRTQPAIRFGNEASPGRLRTVRTCMNLTVQFVYPPIEQTLVLLPRHAVHACRRLLAKCVKALHQQGRCNMVQQCREPEIPVPFCSFTYAFQSRRRVIFPALSPGREGFVGLPFGYPPSLHHLRRGHPFVQWLLRYYGGIRLLIDVSGWITVLDLPSPVRPSCIGHR